MTSTEGQDVEMPTSSGGTDNMDSSIVQQQQQEQHTITIEKDPDTTNGSIKDYVTGDKHWKTWLIVLSIIFVIVIIVLIAVLASNNNNNNDSNTGSVKEETSGRALLSNTALVDLYTTVYENITCNDSNYFGNTTIWECARNCIDEDEYNCEYFQFGGNLCDYTNTTDECECYLLWNTCINQIRGGNYIIYNLLNTTHNLIRSLLPEPGEKVSWDEGWFYLNSSTSYVDEEGILDCYIEYDNITGTTVLNTSWFEMYNRDNILNNLTIDGFILSNSLIMDLIPAQCRWVPAAKIVDIIYNWNTNIIRLYIIEAEFYDYITEMDVNTTNNTLIGVHNTINPSKVSTLSETLLENNVTNATLILYEIECGLFDENGTEYAILNDSECSEEYNETMTQYYGTLLGSDGFISSNDSLDELDEEERRRLLKIRRRLGLFRRIKKRAKRFFAKAKKVLKKVLSPIIEPIVEFVETIIDIITGNIDETKSIGISLSSNAVISLEGEQSNENNKFSATIDGSFEFDAGVELSATAYVNFRAKYKLFSLNPSFDEFGLIIGAELNAGAWLYFELDGTISMDYEFISREQTKIFFITIIPVVVKLEAAATAKLDMDLSVSINLNAGFEPIFIEFGVKYTKSNGWETIKDSNLALVPYFTSGASLDEDDSDTCITASITPAIEIMVGITFYEFLSISLAFNFATIMEVSYPDTCTIGISACNLNEPQLGFNIDLELTTTLSFEVGLEDYGLPSAGIDIDIPPRFTFDVLDTCVDFYVEPIYVACCGFDNNDTSFLVR